MQLPSLSAARSLQTRGPRAGRVKPGVGGVRMQAPTDEQARLFHCIWATGESWDSLVGLFRTYGWSSMKFPPSVQHCIAQHDPANLGSAFNFPGEVEELVTAARQINPNRFLTTKPARPD